MKTTLFIDTTDTAKTCVALEIDGKRVEKTIPESYRKAQTVLPLLEELLRKTNRRLSDIEAITVSTGPGSFTGLRVGIAIANALGALLSVSVNGKPVGSGVLPQYGSSKFDPK
jgi:tRNA threonylcarbamoyladenosine biosynthesis protein TsaB